MRSGCGHCRPDSSGLCQRWEGGEGQELETLPTHSPNILCLAIHVPLPGPLRQILRTLLGVQSSIQVKEIDEGVPTNLRSVMNVQLSWQSFWSCHEGRLRCAPKSMCEFQVDLPLL